ncbi:glycoprotein-N-acetylgalactosamine 3-beta-galactosyltransferase [Achlya hypogyna]|uniref:N-acetylgalactosaminide beta-1,3-galactosyltransferase n=1 Tax=Achlya hypogyna TaxID=1202772 RepID=A0A0A7CPU9_ACHHY|nr:secreted protein [Achlya hypogyna]OQR80823.1 glycoprotein-N-acetylgalactosamine 3-beta-galactosyltransferase [Achlya hypogyna]
MRCSIALAAVAVAVAEDLRYQARSKSYVPRPGLSLVEAALGPHLPALELVTVANASVAAPLRILCWVNTYEKTHDRARAIKETWGKHCDKLLFMSNVEDVDIPTVRVVAPPTHEHLWQKHRFVVRLLAREYDASSYDWIFKCDDDTYVIMDNLQAYLQTLPRNTDEPMLLGHRMTLQWFEMQKPFGDLSNMQRDRRAAFERTFHATRAQVIPLGFLCKLHDVGGLYYTPGGAGYAFNAPYLTQLVAALDLPHCLPDEVVPDDWAISFCMLAHGVTPRDTRDAFQRERFHQYSPEQVYYWPDDEDDYDHSRYESIYHAQNWFSDHIGIGWSNGRDCCAADSISFHYVRDMHLLDAYFASRK